MHNNRLSRRTVLSGAAALLATPAISQVKGPFDDIGPDADPKDLIDKIWDPEKQGFITIPELIDRLVDTPIILIGERHGFAPHQDREAFLLQALADRGRYPTLAMEMLEPAQEPVIQAYRAKNPEYARGLGIALEWSKTGWPDWSYYEPVFDAAFAAKLPIVGADLPLAEQRRIERDGIEERPNDLSILEGWQDAMMKAHCGLIDEERAFRLALKQWKRDEHIAEIVSAAQNHTLIVGLSHLNHDGGLKARFLNQTHRSIAFIEANSPGTLEAYEWRTPKFNKEKALTNC